MTRKKLENGLTLRQAEVLINIANYIIANAGHFPTTRDIVAISGLSSTSNAAYFLDIFIEKGFVVAISTGGRYKRYALKGLRITYPSWYYDLLQEYNIGKMG